MKLQLSNKDDDIKLLQPECRATQQELTKCKKYMEKLKTQKQEMDTSSYEERKKLRQLEEQNTELRDQYRTLIDTNR